MAAPEGAGVVSVRRCHTAELDPAELEEARALLDASFTDLTDHDWEHGLGGMHVLVREDGLLVAHGSLVLRRLLTGGRSLRAGYVEGVAVLPGQRRRGHGGAVMEALEELAPAYDVLALSATDEAVPLYESRGWRAWRGPTSVLGPTGPEPTPDDDGGVLVLGGTGLDLSAPIACGWRDGDVW